MLKVSPSTGEHYKADTNYYCIYKLGTGYFYACETLENPYKGEWDEFIGAFEEECHAITTMNILKGTESRKSRMKQLFKWNTNLKRDLDNYRKRVEENNKK